MKQSWQSRGPMSRLPDLDFDMWDDDEVCALCCGDCEEHGRRKERARIMGWIELDLLLPDGVRKRVLDLIRGGAENGD